MYTKKIINYFPLIIKVLIIIFLLYLLLVEVDLISYSSMISYIFGYILPLVLFLNVILFFTYIKKNLSLKLSTNVITTVFFSIISCLVLLLLIKFKFIKSTLIYVYIYMIFPYMLFLVLISFIYLIKKKQYMLLKRASLKIIVWMFILGVGLFLNKIFS
jgi:hypothetical protein